MQIKLKKKGLKVLSMLMVAMAAACMLSACGGSVKTVSLEGSNGALVKVSVDTIGGTKIKASGGEFSVSMSKGDVSGSLITSSEADGLVSRYYGSETFAEMTVNDGTGFAYDVEDGSVHVIPVDDMTYLQLTAEDDDYIFDLESLMTIESVTAGQDTNNFSENVSKHGVDEAEEQRNIQAIEDAQADQAGESENVSEEDSGNVSESDGPEDPFASH